MKKNTCVFTVKNLHQYIEKLAREEAENLPNSKFKIQSIKIKGRDGYVQSFAIYLMFHLGYYIKECNVQLTKSIMFVVWQKPFHDKTHGSYFL